MRSQTNLLSLSPFLLAMVAAPLAAQARTDSTQVAATVTAFHEALARGDSLAVLGLLASDAVILEAGGIEDRAEYRSHHLGADIAFARAVAGVRGPVRVVIAGDVAWAWSATTVTGTFDGRDVNSQGAELMVLSRSSEGWRIRAIHWSSRSRRR